MKKIELTCNQSVIIDDEDFDLVAAYRWVACKCSKRYYARTYLKDGNNLQKLTSILLHHLIVGKAPKGKRLIFKDGNSLNCQKSNLEFITYGEAAHRFYKKTKNNKNSKEPFKGVVVQYIARVKYNSKIINLGYFSNEKDAAKAYNAKIIELYGDKASINLI